MSKIEIYTARELALRIIDEGAEHDTTYPDETRAGKFFACEWSTVTTQHIVDATIHGPFESREEAEECFAE